MILDLTLWGAVLLFVLYIVYAGLTAPPLKGSLYWCGHCYQGFESTSEPARCELCGRESFLVRRK